MNKPDVLERWDGQVVAAYEHCDACGVPVTQRLRKSANKDEKRYLEWHVHGYARVKASGYKSMIEFITVCLKCLSFPGEEWETSVMVRKTQNKFNRDGVTKPVNKNLSASALPTKLRLKLDSWCEWRGLEMLYHQRLLFLKHIKQEWR